MAFFEVSVFNVNTKDLLKKTFHTNLMNLLKHAKLMKKKIRYTIRGYTMSESHKLNMDVFHHLLMSTTGGTS